MVIVLRPGPVADPVQDPTGFDRVTGSAGLVLFLKKLKRRHFSKKKKTKVNGFATGLPGQPAGSHRVFSSPVFSSTRPGSSPGSGRFQNYKYGTSFLTKI
jgi:hypothetical protein